MVVNVVKTFESPITSLIDADTSLFFINADRQIGVSDGTKIGTSVLGEGGDGEDYEGLNGKLFFDGFSSESGEEPFVNDGTPEGTRLLSDINPTPNETSDPFNFTSVGDVVYFTAFDEANSAALYSSDGTPEGTSPVTDINIERVGDDFGEFIDANGTLYFVADNDPQGIKLYVSDGTAEGTRTVASFDFKNDIENLTVVGKNLYFTREVSPFELWITDGTPEGTSLLTETNIFELEGVGNTLFFTTDDRSSGLELWKSNGTQESTSLVADIRPEERVNGTPRNEGSDPENLTDVNGTLYFSANDGVNGTELWKSDGTAKGTSLVADITEGENSSNLTNFTVVGDLLYFIEENSNSLWQSDGTAEGTFAIEPEEIALGGSTTPSFQNPEQLIEFGGELYFTGEAYDAESEDYLPAVITVEDLDETIVYRLYNPTVGVHFYTTDVTERDTFIDTGNYISEGASYRATEPTAEGAEEVYRFFNETTGVHLYTTEEAERDNIQANISDFAFEGAVFNAYETQVEGTIPVYRFYEPTIGVHLYTPSEVERASVATDLPNYNFEGIAYYARPLEAEPATSTAEM